MKISSFFLLLTILGWFNLPVQAAQYQTGERITVSEPVTENLYVAAGEVYIEAPVQGDLSVAAGKLMVNDSVHHDLMATGASIKLEAFVGDDVRVAGQNIYINASIGGDLIAFGNMIEIGEGVIIGGDVVVCGGYLLLNGKVEGQLKVIGGRVVYNGQTIGETDIRAKDLVLNGAMQGPTVLVANEIELQENAMFFGDVEYWQEDGELEFGPFLRGGKASLDIGLEPIRDDFNWGYFGLGLVALWFIYTFSVILTIMLLVLLLGKYFNEAGHRINQGFIQSFAYGVLYFVGIPLLGMFFIVTIIGIPIGVLLLTLTGFSALFAFSVTSVVLSYAFKVRYQKEWNQWAVMLIALLIFPLLKIISAIPFIGFLASGICIAMVFGALLIPCLPWIKQTETAS